MKNDWRRVLSYVVRWPLAATGRWGTLCKRCDYDGTESSCKHRQKQRETAREFDCQDDSREGCANDGSKESGYTQ